MNHPAPGHGFTADELGRLPDGIAPGGTEMPPPAPPPPAQARAWPPPLPPASRTHDAYGWLDDGLPRKDRCDAALTAAIGAAAALHDRPHQRDPAYTGAQAELICRMFGLRDDRWPAVAAAITAGAR